VRRPEEEIGRFGVVLGHRAQDLLLKQRVLVAAVPADKKKVFLIPGTFPVFVPSLSWQIFGF
jgi:hypothetical protein